MRLVILESPYAGDVERNIAYARACVRDCLARGDSPIASHLLFTQAGILDDLVPEQRSKGIEAGLAWRKKADAVVFYVDRGWSSGMMSARSLYEAEGMPYEIRNLRGEWSDEQVRGDDVAADRGFARGYDPAVGAGEFAS